MEKLRGFIHQKEIQAKIFLKFLGSLVGISLVLSGVRQSLFGMDQSMNMNTKESLTIFGGIAVVTLIPMIEEILFRDILHSLFERKYSWKASVLMSSALFAIGHGHRYVVSSFFNGLIYSWAKKESGTLKMAISLHSSYNFIALLTQLMERNAL